MMSVMGGNWARSQANSSQAGTMPTKLPSESLNHAASPPPGIRAMGNAVLGPRLWRVVLFELHAATSHLFDGSAHVGHMDDRLRELP